jgi:hypothetical protein
MESQANNIIAIANEIGPCTHQNFCDLTNMHPISVRRILPKLVKEKKLYCVKQGMHRPHAYSTRNISHRTDLEHDLARADVATAIHKTGLVTYWHQPRQKFPVDKSVNEDARFQVSIERDSKIGTLHFYLEMDNMGSESYPQIEVKFKRYLALKESSQVLFVLKFNPIRAHRTRPQTLASLAEKYIRKSDKHLWDTFLFADYSEFLADPTGRVCHIPYGSDRYSILSPFVEEAGLLPSPFARRETCETGNGGSA